jgi:hypothetical protein
MTYRSLIVRLSTFLKRLWRVRGSLMKYWRRPENQLALYMVFLSPLRINFVSKWVLYIHIIHMMSSLTLFVQGLETSMGYVAWLGKYEEENSILVDLLLKAGAVFYVKTSVPQSLMLCETVNNVIGSTNNPRSSLLIQGVKFLLLMIDRQ